MLCHRASCQLCYRNIQQAEPDKVLDVDELSGSSGDHVTDLRYVDTVRHKEQNTGIIDKGCHGVFIYNEAEDTGDVADLSMIGRFIERTL